MINGKIVRLIKGKSFGFIKADGDDRDDIFFYATALRDVRFNELEEGQRVEFELGKGPKGPRAERITLI